ncbi:MAG TPA: transposase [Edaphocola sp.]|nr:transposase [Edaphocola sp.]
MKIEYNNLYVHYILTTKNRHPFIKEINRERIEKYITGIVNNTGSKLYAVYANPEHAHLLISKNPIISDQELMTVVADSSQKFIVANKLCSDKFQWQDSAAAFSVSKGDIDKVCKYIMNQPEHHKKKTYQDEYDEFLAFYQQTLKWER